jgi:CHAT domain-containing protein
VKTLRRALAEGDRSEIAKWRVAAEAAHGKVLDLLARIQREAKAAADVLYPKAKPLQEIQGLLSEGHALVLYGLLPEDALALVVTGKSARIVKLGETSAIETACATLPAQDSTSDPANGIRSLRRLIVEPLGLERKTTRLLVSPHGVLANVPFALLAPGREVVMVPSGTTYGVLLDEKAKRGEKVLAIGDPDYGVKPDPRAVSVMRAGATLRPLPATRKEVTAIGDVVLVDEQATESELASVLGAVDRWRAVHFACHGFIRADQPQLSSLALTPDEHNDGFLTVLEVFRMKIPADLVVLSACETAKGRIYKAEGVIGFTRAFMMAGAPRVIVSLWKVDDEATGALMVKFYELWKPGKMASATALKKAQEYVASHEKWKHMYYCAAWQLWGLGD